MPMKYQISRQTDEQNLDSTVRQVDWVPLKLRSLVVKETV